MLSSKKGWKRMYVYMKTETDRETGSYALFTVGYYSPDGEWHPESDHGGPTGREDVANRTAWLNGGSEKL